MLVGSLLKIENVIYIEKKGRYSHGKVRAHWMFEFWLIKEFRYKHLRVLIAMEFVFVTNRTRKLNDLRWKFCGNCFREASVEEPITTVKAKQCWRNRKFFCLYFLGISVRTSPRQSILKIKKLNRICEDLAYLVTLHQAQPLPPLKKFQNISPLHNFPCSKQ